jgi:CBS-domain-containing membrane protein
MALTGTVHPPAGATALIAVLDDHVAPLGFFLLVPVCLSCGLMLCVALLVNNVQRRFPFYWWSPQETGSFWRRAKVDIERETGRPDTVDRSERRLREKKEYSGRGEQQAEEELTSSSGDLELGRRVARSVSLEHGREGEIVIRRGRVRLPDGLMLRPEELLFLETLGERLGHLGHSEKPY